MLNVKMIAGVIVLGAAMVSTASAGTIVYTSEAAFDAATTNQTTVGFDGILSTDPSFENFDPLVVSGNTFSDPDAGVFVNVTSADYYGAGFTYPDDFIVNSQNSGDNELDVTFATPTLAFGLDYGGFSGGGSGTITASDGTAYTNTSLPGVATTDFVGFVSSAPLTGFTFVVSGDAWVVEDLVFAQTPEPQSWSLLLIALCAGVPMAMRRRKALLSYFPAQN